MDFFEESWESGPRQITNCYTYSNIVQIVGELCGTYSQRITRYFRKAKLAIFAPQERTQQYNRLIA